MKHLPIILIAVTASGCAVNFYTPPPEGPTANLTVQHELGNSHMYTYATVYNNPRICTDPQFFRQDAKASEPLKFSLAAEREQTIGLSLFRSGTEGGHIQVCTGITTFYPEKGANYVISLKPQLAGCIAVVRRMEPGNENPVDQRARQVIDLRWTKSDPGCK